MASQDKPSGQMLWGGRFAGGLDPLMVQSNESIYLDKVLYKQDILGSIAFARANAKSGIISQDEFSNIESGLRAIVPGVDEDIHTANERRLGEVIGKDVAGKLHTGRSRNEQVATDMCMWLRDEMRKLEGYLSPLGCGALAGNPFGIDRDMMAKELGFEGLLWNSMGGVGDRDFVAEFLQWGSMLMQHISRWAEDLIIYSTAEFGFLADAAEEEPGQPGGTGTPMNELSYKQLKGIGSRFEKDIAESFDYEKSVEMRAARGGTSKSSVLEQIEVLKAMLG
ncbi:L-Aspartase-like protein [Coniochaeta ligniaria NRRL 30616]|uniref:argininosuccinate lyase n=1 Tax=Coniochaeta ligniaria NRRL 30616 TaxID=1408157 RepID=A0A1J7J6Z8_9PEZI|nr:L-Aspartase-like protein [Coniochaeta ligniaria NRRL 30616]